MIKTLENIHDHCYWRDILDGSPLDDMEITSILTDEQLSEIKERAFVFGYQQTLQSMDPTIAIKLSALRFPLKERTMFYLFLTTHDPTGALKLNQLLHEAKLLEYELRYKVNTLRHIPPGQMSFWDPVQNVPEPPFEDRPSINEIANEIYRRLSGKSLVCKQVYICLIDTLFFPNEIENALKLLKKWGKLEYSDKRLNHRTQINFLANIHQSNN